jgi:ABC-type nitrate/sulfonate/bicarbonate transport system substrate-binding protein
MKTIWKKSAVAVSVFALIALALALWQKTDIQLAATRPLRVQLQWLPGGQFVGFYLAEDRGYYASEGLAVTFLHGGPNIDPIKNIATDHADVGLATADQVLKWNDRTSASGKEEQLRALGTVFIRSLAVFMTHTEDKIRGAADFKGKRIGVFPSYDTESILRLLLKKANLPLTEVTQVNFPSFVNFERHEVDAYGSYIINEPVLAEMKKIPFTLIDPLDYDVHFYSDTIVATRSTYDGKRDLLERFVRASARGWHDAKRAPQVALDSMKKQIGVVIPPGEEWEHQKRVAERALRYVADRDGPEIFLMDPVVWRSMEADLADLGVLARRGLVEQLCDFDFVHRAKK